MKKALIALLAVAVATGGVVTVAAKRSEARIAHLTRPADPDPVASPSEAPATPVATPAEKDVPVAARKRIEVSLAKQQLIAWDDGAVAFRMKISTGRPGFDTPAGSFKVHSKFLNRWSRKWKVWMPYAMFWHPQFGYAFHELPYYPGSTHRIGASRLGRADSHGCIRVGVGDAQRLYEWTPLGTPVWIH